MKFLEKNGDEIALGIKWFLFFIGLGLCLLMIKYGNSLEDASTAQLNSHVKQVETTNNP